ncbi:hemolysin secretion protein D [Skermanella stibiiresistens SB22]|uniref:Membrane fusion protein (MFP) family protein n=1 Tax=Skermanella stibiiresistens SB22 TaxID=1385369 RepID=W9HBE8_9PROT|nr:HlyD family type I secretion periplasmic adaptor subunit [Skermanella stibiiresistens]EWY41178.1 hemolysin secretion protein D [Skermanella stibiiresistens SB22]
MRPAEALTRPTPASKPAKSAKPSRRNRHELAFLPAALEIVETPPSPAGRATALALSAFVVVALVWAWFGHVDVVAIAEGRIVPDAGTQLIQPKELGIVREIRVRDGQSVRAGDVLIELDPTESVAERDRLAREVMEAGMEAVRLHATLAAAEAHVTAATATLAVPDGTDPTLATLHRELLRSRLGEYQSKMAALGNELVQRQAERSGILAEQSKLRTTLPLIRERVEALQYLARKDLTPKLGALELQQQLVEAEQDLEIQNHRLTQVDAQVVTLRDSHRQAEQEFRATTLTAVADAERKLAGLRQELIKAEDRRQRQQLTAPIDGIVQQLDVHTVGGVVTPAQKLMVIVPRDGKLRIEALVANRDIGFVREGQDAEIKVETFTFTKYGLLQGKVLHLSRDALAPTPSANAADGQNRPRAPDGPVYTAYVSLERTVMMVDGQEIPLGPGMAVSVEIKTDQRRVIEYLLAPLLRYRQESLRER